MGEEGLLGLSLPAEHGGLVGNYLSIAVVGEALLGRGHNPGIVLSWLLHNAVARFLILGFGDQRQQDTYLRRLASGEITAALAISEPGRGAHPKHIETSANRQGDSYVLRGEKSYLTNGPIADLFIVIAATEIDEGRRRFSSFLVSKDAAGLSLTEPMHLDFLRPSPHGGIILSDCAVPMSALLGKEGHAYEEMVKPFRALEDGLMMGPMVGAMGSQVEFLTKHLREQDLDSPNELKQDLGELQSLLDTLRILAYETAGMLDSSVQHPEFPSLLISFRNLSTQFQDRFEHLMDIVGIEKDHELRRFTKDLVVGGGMGRKVALNRQRRLGERLLSGKESDEFMS